jgi:hypothetical protein
MRLRKLTNKLTWEVYNTHTTPHTAWCPPQKNLNFIKSCRKFEWEIKKKKFGNNKKGEEAYVPDSTPHYCISRQKKGGRAPKSWMVIRWRVCDKPTASLFFKFHWLVLSFQFPFSFSSINFPPSVPSFLIYIYILVFLFVFFFSLFSSNPIPLC